MASPLNGIAPKPVYEAYWEEVARYVKPNQTIVEIGPGNGFYTDRFLPDATKSYLVDYSQVLCYQLLPDKYKDNPKVSIIYTTNCRMPTIGDGEVDLVFSLASFVHIDIETIYGYLLESHRILRQDGIVVLQYASMVGDDAFQWYVDHCPPDFSRHTMRCQHPQAMVNLAGRVGFEVIRHVVEKCFCSSFIHLRKP